MDHPLLLLKFYTPQLNLVLWPRLYNLLNEGLEKKLTILMILKSAKPQLDGGGMIKHEKTGEVLFL